MTSFPNCLKRRKDKLMSMLEEDLTVVSDTDFDDLFPTPDTSSPSDLDDVITVVGEEDDEPVVTKITKKRGRPAKSTAEPKKISSRKKKTEEDEEFVVVHKKRGRPATKKDVEPEIVEESTEKEEEIPVVPVKKTRAKRVSVDDINPEILEKIFEEYSQRPVSEFAKELGLSEHHIKKAVDRMKELFETSIATGDLTQEDYEEFIVPKLTEYSEPKDDFESFVHNTIKKIRKKK